MALSRVRRCCTGRRVARSLLVLAVFLSAAFVPAAVAAPPNDAFVDAVELTGLPVEVRASNVGATRELGEPVARDDPAFPPGGHSLWWRWTAARSGHVAVQTCGSAIQTALGVYLGETLGALTEVRRREYGCEGRDGSRVAFFATAGRVYRISVDNRLPSEKPGKLRLEVRQSGSVALRLLANGGLAQVVYRAAPGETNVFNVLVDWGPPGLAGRSEPLPPPVRYYVDDIVSAGPGCSAADVWLSCEIPPGALSTGPVLYLGDRDDDVGVEFSRARTEVFGGLGSDRILSGGRVSGGPGNDEISARPWVRSRVAGGPGNDEIYGSLREDLIDPGPGMDFVATSPDTGEGGFVHFGRDVIRARDGASDAIDCGDDVSTALIDGVDYYPLFCGRVKRRGAARAVPESFYNNISYGSAQVRVECPADGPRLCVGSLTVSGHGVTLRRAFRIRREDRDLSETGDWDLPAPKRKLRRLVGKVKVTVRSKVRNGKTKSASAVFSGVELE
jgi:hypothetical protein